jgi:hypothetical protein
VQCRGIGRQLQQLSSGSTPHDRVTIPQICLARSPALDRPRQSTLRYPTGVSNRPTGHHARRDPLPIHQPASPSANSLRRLDPNHKHLSRLSNLHNARGTAFRSLTRGFLPWRLSDAGRRTRGAVTHAAGIRNPSQSLPKSAARATSAFPPKAAGALDVPARSGGTGLATSVKRMGEAGAARAIYATVDIVALRARGLLLGGYHG